MLGEVLYHVGRLRSADASLRRCIELGWDTDVNLWTLLGNTQRLLGELPEAIVCLERALELSAGSAAARSNLSIAYAQVGRFDEAIDHLRMSIKLEPENDIMHSNASYVLLTAGEIVEGWYEWEWGLLGPRGSERPTNKPRWTPERPDGRVLCYREQGIGDEILFASCYPDLLAAASDVVIETDPRVATLFGRSFPTAAVRPQTINLIDGETMHDFDYAIPAGSLPQHYRASVDAFPDRTSFLVADPERVAAWQARLAEIGPGPFVGMSWRSRVKTAERRLEYTQLDQWGELFAIPGINWVNLQYDDCERDLLAAERNVRRDDPPLGLARPDERLRGGRGADDVPRPRRVTAQRGGDARRRPRRADRDDGQPLGLVGPRYRHVAVVPDDPARVPPPGRGVGRGARDRRRGRART